MFIKRKTRAGKVYAYRMLPSFKTLVTYKQFFKLHAGLSFMKQLLPDITRFFAGHCPMSVANIQACKTVIKSKISIWDNCISKPIKSITLIEEFNFTKLLTFDSMMVFIFLLLSMLYLITVVIMEFEAKLCLR